MTKERKAGVLLPISSLPAPYGIGTMGESAYRFIDWLKAAGMKLWQVLPLLPTNYGDSPYQSCASDALNYYFIDLDALEREGLLEKADYAFLDWGADPRRVDYEKLFLHRAEVLKKAFARFDRTASDWKKFLKTGKYRDFALFM
ncbi:MAG: 4-alpha-glucanotransferase, partial [Coriobacteriales bacterium]